MHGPTPKPPSKRRRRTPPASYGAAEPTTAPAAGIQDRQLDIGEPVHQLVEDLWAALQTSAEARFFSLADWQRARLELWYCNHLLTADRPIPGNAWAVVQAGLSALLISPAEKRRCGIEVRPPGPDRDEDAAILTIAKYHSRLESD